MYVKQGGRYLHHIPACQKEPGGCSVHLGISANTNHVTSIGAQVGNGAGGWVEVVNMIFYRPSTYLRLPR